MRPIKYDYKQVVELYEQGNSTREVAVMINGSKSTISEIIKKYGKSRPKTIRRKIFIERAKKCSTFSKEFINYLDGLLISDGYLSKPTSANACYYSQSCINKQWLEEIKNVFYQNGITSTLAEDKRKNIVVGWILRTYSYDQFFYQYNRWYGAEKYVPKDIQLTPLLLKNWIYGDGTLSKSSLRFCTDSFNKSDMDWLKEEFLKIGFIFNHVFMGKTKAGKDKWRLSLCKTNGLENFYKYVGKCDVDCFIYKWYPRIKE